MNLRGVLGIILAAASLATTGRAEDATPPPVSTPSGQPATGGQPRPHGELFQSFTPAQQERLLKLLDDWSKLTPEQRHVILDRFGQSRNLTPDQREKLQRHLERIEQMPPEQREHIREHLHKWAQMTPEERQEALERERENRRKAEADLAQRLDELGVQPTPEQMRWIHQFYFQKKRQIDQQVSRHARELKSGLPTDASEEQKQQVRQQAQQYRHELEQQAMQNLTEFARNPHPLPAREGKGEGEHGKQGSSSNAVPRKSLPPANHSGSL